jgi:hypothetical protein
MYALLRWLDSEGLVALAVLGGRQVRACVEAELDRRAAAALVRRILHDGASAPRPAARHSVKATVAA